jgi:cysteinyl-tRNA synthetase
LKQLRSTVDHALGQSGPGSSMEGNDANFSNSFLQAIFDDLNTSKALTILDAVLAPSALVGWDNVRRLVGEFDEVLGLNLLTLTRKELRIRPTTATITEPEIEGALAARKEARAAKDFATSDRIRDDLIAKGVDVMDGDPLEWDWKITL